MVQVSICVGSSCHLKGSYQVIQIFKEVIRKKNLKDEVELKASFCLGRCTKGVAVLFDNECVEDLTLANAAAKLEDYLARRNV